MQKFSREALKLKLDNEAIKKSMLLYAITDRAWLKEGETLEEVVEDVLKSGATFLQLREKIQGHEEIVEMAKKLQALCKKYNVPFVVNDDTMAAKEIDADGVHIGQSDMEYTKAREILGPDKIIGVSAGNLQEAKEAEKLKEKEEKERAKAEAEEAKRREKEAKEKEKAEKAAKKASENTFGKSLARSITRTASTTVTRSIMGSLVKNLFK